MYRIFYTSAATLRLSLDSITTEIVSRCTVIIKPKDKLSVTCPFIINNNKKTDFLRDTVNVDTQYTKKMYLRLETYTD